jgi:2'-5' RNA ligase
MRVFIAIDVSDSAKGHLEREIERGRADSAESKWVKSGELHVTLVFIGNVEEPKGEDILRIMAGVAAKHRAMKLSLGGGGSFGASAHPHVLFSTLEGEVERLNDIQRDLATALEGIAPKEARTFTPHVTLARSKERRGDVGLAKALTAIRAAPKDPFVVSELVLYRSDTRPTGATYVRLGSAAFGEAT